MDDPLAEQVITELTTRWPELLFRKGEPGTIQVSIRESGEDAWIMNLATVRERCLHDPENGLAGWLDDPQMNRMLALAAGKVSPPEITRDSLHIRLSDRRRFENLEGDVPHRELFGNVWGHVVFFHEEWGARYLEEQEFTELGLDFEAAWTLALENTGNALRGLEMQGVGDEEGNLALIVLDHVHASAALLIPPLRAHLAQQIGFPYLACIPATDEAIVMPLGGKTTKYLQTAAESYANSAHPVSDQLLLVEADSISLAPQ